jgi:hypothetical protein
MITINKNNYLKHHLTPWNDKVLNYLSNEISEFKFESLKNADKLLKDLELTCLNEQIQFTSIRFDGNNLETKYVLSKNDYYFAEASYVLIKNISNISLLSNKIPKLKIEVEFYKMSELSEGYLSDILNIASKSFNHGRFAEDFNFNKKVSNIRNQNWIFNELNGDNEISILKCKNNVVGFMMFSIIDDNASLLLGGIEDKYRIMAYNFWFKLLEHLHFRSIVNINVIISAANTSVVNIYSFFEFKFSNFLLGFHKNRFKL